MDIFPWVGLALTAAVLTLTIKQYQPVFALFTAMAAGICILGVTVQIFGEFAGKLKSIADISGISKQIYLPVAKAVGIAAVVRVAGALCKDAGQQALAVKLDIFGSVAALAACLPLFDQLLSLVGNLVK